MFRDRAAKAMKAALPGPVRRLIQRIRRRTGLAERAYAGLSTQDVFEKIYRTGAWGKDAEGAGTSGSGSHDRAITEPYVDEVRRLMSAPDIRVAVDLGCGDFNVGKHFVDLCDSYVACDISNTVLEMNRARHRAPSLTFRRLDIAADDLPEGDIFFVRQVLQHLGNDQIARFVRKLNTAKPCTHLLVTEHLPAGDFVPNIDKPTGAGVRVHRGGGVDIAAAPFSLEHLGATVLLDIPKPTGGVDATIRTVLYRLK